MSHSVTSFVPCAHRLCFDTLEQRLLFAVSEPVSTDDVQLPISPATFVAREIGSVGVNAIPPDDTVDPLIDCPELEEEYCLPAEDRHWNPGDDYGSDYPSEDIGYGGYGGDYGYGGYGGDYGYGGYGGDYGYGGYGGPYGYGGYGGDYDARSNDATDIYGERATIGSYSYLERYSLSELQGSGGFVWSYDTLRYQRDVNSWESEPLFVGRF